MILVEKKRVRSEKDDAIREKHSNDPLAEKGRVTGGDELLASID